MLLLAAVGTLATDTIPSSCNRHRNLICIGGGGGGGGGEWTGLLVVPHWLSLMHVI